MLRQGSRHGPFGSNGLNAAWPVPGPYGGGRG